MFSASENNEFYSPLIDNFAVNISLNLLLLLYSHRLANLMIFSLQKMYANCTDRRKKQEYTNDLHKIRGTPIIGVAQSTHNPHLIPIFSLCFCSARSAIDCDANWTYASPEARPISSANRAIPLGTICIPVNPHTNPQNITVSPTSLSQQ